MVTPPPLASGVALHVTSLRRFTESQIAFTEVTKRQLKFVTNIAGEAARKAGRDFRRGGVHVKTPRTPSLKRTASDCYRFKTRNFQAITDWLIRSRVIASGQKNTLNHFRHRRCMRSATSFNMSCVAEGRLLHSRFWHSRCQARERARYFYQYDGF